jgi:uncharacterized membrane protein YvlD (DUF360 family)
MTAPTTDGKGRLRFSRFNWRALVVRLLSNTVVIGVLILVLPGFELTSDNTLLSLLWLALLFGALSALLRPVLEFLLLPYLLQTFGLVVVLINVVLLALLDLSNQLDITSLLALLVGAVLAGVIGFFLENLLGLSQPILPDDAARPSSGQGAA